jgi:hypothetical protein
MQAKYFEREVIHEFTDDGPVRLCRMTFTDHELRAIGVMLQASLGTVGYTFTSKTIANEFRQAWLETGVRADTSAAD